MTAADTKRTLTVDPAVMRGAPLILGFAALAVPTTAFLADQAWTKEAGAQGPLILALGAWLLWRQWPALRREASPGGTLIAFALLAVSLVAYVAGRMFDYLTFEAGGLYGVGVTMLYALFGARALRTAWFPLLFLAFAIPPPGVVMDHLTSPLKHFAAFVSTEGLAKVGLPVAREGVTITIAQYQLLVEDACSGMNSIIGLTAISLLYIYLLRRTSPVYALLLTLFVIPLAVAANTLRIVAIILITYIWGDEVGQSFIHMAAGLFLFTTALLLVFALDRVFHPLYARMTRRPA
ncbi:MAG TPA: exosortase V [Caulobacteraceae bacterium]|jgi:exosortase